MSLRTLYDKFAAQPRGEFVNDDATLSYISSGTNVVGGNEIIKYILRSRHEVQIAEKVLAYHEGHDSLTVEIAADCKFKEGPSWVAPGVDGNLLDGKVAQLPLVPLFPVRTF